MNLTGPFPKAFVPATVMGLFAVLLVAATDFKNIERGVLVFGCEALASGVLVWACIKLSKFTWSWFLSSCAVFGVFLLVAAVVPRVFFP